MIFAKPHNVLYKLDPFTIRRLTGKSSLRGLELPRLEQW